MRVTVVSSLILRRRPELVPVMEDSALPFLPELPGGGLDLHPNLHLRGVDVMIWDVRRQSSPISTIART